MVRGQEADPLPDPAIDELRGRIAEEAPSELVGLKLGDTDVSLQLSGYWKGTLQGNLGFSSSPLGTRAVSPDSPVLFTQEADLTLSLWIRDRWFVEANFLDNTDVNTYRAGYQGLPGEIVQYAGIGNTGLDFPAFPYLDLGGDSPSSFGFYSHLRGGNLDIHTLFRYDAAAREERIFVGDRERSFSYVSPQNPVRGISFVLPDTGLDSEPQVYLEDEKGTLIDTTSRRRWRLAGPSEYAAGRGSGLIELSVSPKGMVAVAYTKGGNNQPWLASMGNYNIPGPSGQNFLYEVQQWFDPSGSIIDLRNYPQSGGGSGTRPGSVNIGGTPALVVREPGAFSPFERQNRYEAPSSTSALAALVRVSSGQDFSGYEVIPLDAGALSADIPLYAVTETMRGFYELVRNGSGGNQRNPETRWPLAEQFPNIYLPGAAAFTEDLSLRFTNYGSAGAYSIGTDVVSGSVQVWRSGIQDPNFSYNAASGTVSLASPAGFNEVIRITYLKRSDETRLGSIAAGLGAVYHKEYNPFSLALALGIRWNLTSDTSFTEEGVSNPGAVGLSVKTSWDYDYLKTQVTAGLAFEQPDTTGLYRAAGMEGNEIALALTPDTSFISQPPNNSVSGTLFTGLDLSNRADLVYRNYRDTSVLGSSSLMSIDWSGATTVSGQNKPYPVKDSQLTGEAHVLTAEFTLDQTQNWTGFEVPLREDAALLARAREIEIPFRFYGFNGTPPADFKLVLQIGSLSGKDIAFDENAALIMESTLYPPPPGAVSNNPAAFSQDARIARFVLGDNDRLKLGDAQYLRLIAVYDSSVPASIQGRVLLAPPIVRGTSFRPITFDGTAVREASDSSGNGEVKSAEMWEAGGASLEAAYGDIIKRLHNAGSRQRVLEVQWENMASDISAGADGRIPALPLANYRVLSFFVRGPERSGGGDLDSNKGGTLSFIIAEGPDALANAGSRRLEAEIPLSAFRPGVWSKVSIRYLGKDQGISVDGGDASGARFKYRPQQQMNSGETQPGRAAYAAVLVNPTGRDISAAGPGSLPPGNFRVDEIILEEASPEYRLNLGTMTEYRRSGTLLAIGKTPALADLSISTTLESEARGDPFIRENEAALSLINRSNGEISFFGAKVTGNLAFTAARETFLWSAGHGISRSWGPFLAGESFSVAPRDNSADHRFNLGFSSIFFSRFDAEALYELSRLDRKWNLALGVNPPPVYIPSASVNAFASWTEHNAAIDEYESYGGIWVRSWEPMLPDLGTGAEKRTTRTLITITEATKPVGAVLAFEGSTDLAKANQLGRLQNAARLDMPIVLGKSSLNLQAERGFKRHLRFYGADALDDGRVFFESVGDSLPLWGVVPLYSLFAPVLNDAMDKSLAASPQADLTEYTFFNDRFGFTARFPSWYDLKAFFIPSSAGGRIERILEQKMDTRFDVLHIGGNLGFSAINMFGVLGYLPLFDFYQGDEFTHTVESAVAIPRDEELSWRAQSNLGAGFYGFSGSILSFSNTFTFGSSGWLESISAEWTAPTRRSLLSIFYNWIARTARTQSSWLSLSSLLNSKYEQMRKESLELSFDHSGDYLRWTLGLGHESIIRILGRLNFSVFAKLDCTDDLQSETLSFVGTVGLSLNLSF
ncbi:hypothetical protein AGMMS50293_14280 [Spirochaetia bacterium]|nr:hypothetical protein AGMMS50293_14280 [Spirochaetia bacterium]